MPELDELIDARRKDQQEFADAFEEVVGKTDEEIEKNIQAAKEAETSDETGVVTKDQKTESQEAQYSFDNPNANTGDEKSGQTDKAVTEPSPNELQAKIEALEAELLKERQRTSSWDGRIRAANNKAKALEEENAELRAKLEEKASSEIADQEMSDKEKMDVFKENFPELTDFADIMQRQLDAVKKEKATKVKVEPKPEPEIPAEQSPADPGQNTHMDKIRAAHADVDEIASSGALLTWINEQPEYLRPGLRNLYDNGTASQLISMLTEFKTKSGWTSKARPVADKTKQDKLNSMRETASQGAGPKNLTGPDPNDFAAAAKEIGL